MPLAVGTRVRWASLGIVGEVLALHGEDEAELAVSGKRVRVPRAELVALAGARASGGRHLGGGGRHAVARAVPAEINLIGLTVDEALPRVDKLLDDASLVRAPGDPGHPRLRRGPAAQGGGRAARRPPPRGVVAAGPARTRAAAERRRGAEGLAMAFPEGFVEEVRRAADIVKVISDHVGAEEDGHLLEGAVPLPRGEDPVLQRPPGARRSSTASAAGRAATSSSS